MSAGEGVRGECRTPSDGAWEEIDYLSGGGIGGENFGWPCYEGEVEFNTSGCGPVGDYVFPITTLPHDPSPNNNCSVIGGYRYRGAEFSRLAGWYFYADWCTGFLWAAEPGVGETWVVHNVDFINTFVATGFGESEDGELYIAAAWMGLLRVVDPQTEIFIDGFESGDVSAWSSSSP